MEKEEEYKNDSLEEKKEGLEPKSSGAEIENREPSRHEESALQGKNFLAADREANPWSSQERKKSRIRGFTRYVRFIWPYVLIITFVFFGSLVAGYAWAVSSPDMANDVMQNFSSRFQPFLNMEPLSIMFAIFLNNAFVSLISLVLGLALGILPILFIAFNGYVIGVISYVVAQQRGFLFIFLALLPHGILELPMVFLSAAIGLRLGHQVISALLGKETDVKREFAEGIRFYISWIVPLLLLAAIIETFITPLILSFL